MRKQKPLTGRSLRLLHTLFEKSLPTTNYTVSLKQSELAEELGITRQALNVHLRRLRDLGYIRTGRGFIDITERGLTLLGVTVNPAFIFIKVTPKSREQAYEKMSTLPAQRIFRVTGDIDAILIVEGDKLDETLKKLAAINGIKETKSYVTIKALK
jgi:DNA-binding Lrp family transcriptional regulator